MTKILTALLCSLTISLPANAQGIGQMTMHEQQFAIDSMIAIQPALRNQNDRTFDYSADGLPNTAPVVEWSADTIKNIWTQSPQSADSVWSSQIMRVNPELFGYDDGSSVYAIIEGDLKDDYDTNTFILNFRRFCPNCAPGGDPIVGDPVVPRLPTKPTGTPVVGGAITLCDPNDANNIMLAIPCRKPDHEVAVPTACVIELEGSKIKCF